MDREQAKLIGQMSDEQLKAVGKKCWIENRAFIVAFGNGGHVEVKVGDQWFRIYTPVFDSSNKRYRIASPKIVFNGVEMDAPIKDKDANPDVKYYGAVFDGEAWHHRYQSYGAICSLENVTPVWFERLEACLTYCDTHNKMMGVEG